MYSLNRYEKCYVMFNIVHSSGWFIAVFFTPLLLVWNVAKKKKKKGVHVPCITDPDVDTSTCLSNKINTIH